MNDIPVGGDALAAPLVGLVPAAVTRAGAPAAGITSGSALDVGLVAAVLASVAVAATR